MQAARIAELEEHLKSLEVDQQAAEAKHRLYTLLQERTKCTPCAAGPPPSEHPPTHPSYPPCPSACAHASS